MNENEKGAPAILLVWWGTEPGQHATIGDFLALRAVAQWLMRHGRRVVVAARSAGRILDIPALDWRVIEPRSVEAVCFVCGPLLGGPGLTNLLDRFPGKPRIAVGVSVVAGDPALSQFDTVVPRDSDDGVVNFDLALSSLNDLDALFPDGASGMDGPPVKPGRLRAALCLRGQQDEYGAACEHERVVQAVRAIAPGMAAGWWSIDTVYRGEKNPLWHVMKLFRRSDLVVTTRLHGALFAAVLGRPTIAIDQIPGGRKVSRVLGRIGFPALLPGEEVDAVRLEMEIRRVLGMPRDARAQLGRKIVEASDAALEQAGQAIMARLAVGQAAVRPVPAP